MARKRKEPTQRQRDVLAILAAGGVIDKRIEGSRMYQLYSGACSGNDAGYLADALTVAEVTALAKAGWIQDRENGDSGNPRLGGEYIITEAGDDLVGADHG